MKIKFAGIATVLALLLFGCATQRTLSESKDKWHPREALFQSMETADLEAEAETGDLEARFHLAVRLMSGDRMGKDAERAALIAQDNALEGDPRFQYLYAAALSSGLGVEANETEAAQWFQKSAQGGYVTGEFWHGFMLSRGRGYPAPDWKEAIKWFQRAANKGHVDAQFTLGEAYHSCRGGLSRDYEAAAHWYRVAYQKGKGSPLARENLQRLIDTGLVEWQEGDPGAPPITLKDIEPELLTPCS